MLEMLMASRALVNPWPKSGGSIRHATMAQPPIYQVPIDFFSSLTPSAVGIESSHVPAHNSCAT